MFNFKCAVLCVTGVLVGIVAAGCAAGDDEEQPVVASIDSDSTSMKGVSSGNSASCYVGTTNVCRTPSKACGVCPDGKSCTLSSDHCAQPGCDYSKPDCSNPGGTAVTRIVCPTGYRYCSLYGQCISSSYYASVCQ